MPVTRRKAAAHLSVVDHASAEKAQREEEKRKGRRLLAKLLRRVPDEFLDCMDRSIGHPWEKLNGYHVVPATTHGRSITHVARDFRCPNCTMVKTERYIVVKVNGQELLQRVGVPSYSRVDGYQLPGVPRGARASDVLHMEQYRRSMERAVGAVVGERATAER